MPEGLDLRQLLCMAMREGTDVGEVMEESQTYELPFSYLDGSPIEILVEPGPLISDDGKTISRLHSEGRLEEFLEWEDVLAYCRTHRMRKEGSRLYFSGDLSDPLEILRFIEGIRDLEVKSPRVREKSTHFDAQIRAAVKTELKKWVDAGRLSPDTSEEIVNPDFSVRVTSPVPMSLRVPADFRSKDGRCLVVVLSHGGDTTSSRQAHIRSKLAEHIFLRARRDIRSVAVIPQGSFYGPEEEALLLAFTGQAPLPVTPRNAGKKLLNILLSSEGGLQDSLRPRR